MRPIRAGNMVYMEQVSVFWSGWGNASDTLDGSWMVLEVNTRGVRWWPATQGMAAG